MSSTDHYKPQHPLPQELQDLSRNDTVCQFCGVSYLIHNEIKKLEEKLQSCEEEIKRLRTFDEREIQLKSEIKKLNLKQKELVDVLNTENERNLQFQNAIAEKNNKISQIEQFLLERDDTIVLLKNTLKDNEEKVQRLEIGLVNSKKDLSKIREGIYSMKVSYMDLQNSFHDLMKNFWYTWEEQHEHVTKYLETSIQSHKKKNEQLEIAMKNLESKYKKELAEMTNDHVKLQKQINENHIKDMKALSEREEKMKLTHTEEVHQWKMENETLKIQLCQLQDDFNSSCEESSQKIKILQSETSTLQSKLKTLQENQSGRTEELLQSLQKVQKEKDCLQEERQRMIDTHQRRIQELRESFLHKLSEAEKWPDKLSDALKNQQLKFNEEKNQLQKKLSDSHNQMNLQKEKEYRQEILNERKRYEEMEKELDRRMKSREKSLEEKLDCLRKQLNESQCEKEKIAKSFREENEMLQQEIQLLQAKVSISAHSAGSVDRLKELEKVVTSIKGELHRKSNVIEENEKEIQSLRDCVRRECEERYELTESLAEARTELLAYQRCYGSFKTNKQDIVPSPPIYGRKSSTHSSISDYQNCVANHNNSQNFDTHTDNGDKSRQRIDVAVGRYAKTRLRISKIT